MIRRISENQFIEVENEQEQFSIITGFNDLTYDEDPKTDDAIYLVQDYYTSDLPLGQKYFMLSCTSLEEYYEVIRYLVINGYRKKLKFEISNPSEYKGEHLKREVWSLERIDREFTRFDKIVNIVEPYWYQLRILVKVDKNKLNGFREILKRLPGYKFNWLLVDREPFAKSDRIFK